MNSRWNLLVAALAATLALVLPGRVWAQGAEVTVTVKAPGATVRPGQLVPIAVVFDHQEGWHVHTNDPVPPPGVEPGTLTPTSVVLTPPAGVTVGPVQWPTPKTIPVDLSGKGKPSPYAVYAGRAIAFVPVRVDPAAKEGDTLTLPVEIEFQACNDTTCLAPDGASHAVTLTVGAAAPVTDPDFAGFDVQAAEVGMTKGATPPPTRPARAAGSKGDVKFDVFGYGFTIDPRGAGLVLLLLAAALGGLLLNFTPCVLPVVPLKIMGLSQAAGHPHRALLLGGVMSLGVVLFWLVLGGLIAFVSGFSAISTLFQTPWFSLGVGLFVLVMSFGMLGAFAVRLPQAVYMINPSHETVGGSLIFGVLTAVLSTPCTAPFMGTAAAWAATQPSGVTLATFGAIGAGMALPYLVLSAFPSLLSFMPRTGPASELIKQVMGLLMVAVACYFLGLGVVALIPDAPDWARATYWWAVAFFAVAAMGWMVYQTFRITRRPFRRAVFAFAGIVFAAVTVRAADHFASPPTTIAWEKYSPQLVSERLGAGRVVVLEFTAEWCLNCKTLEATVLSTDAVVGAFRRPGVTPVKVDLTARQAAGWDRLKALGEVGIPLLAVLAPGSEDPVFKSNAYTPDQVVRAVDAALAKARTAQGGPGTPAPKPAAGG